ncbi:sel1 repeat family protein [Akkermansiaceae bacterium]|nr:sel1 repeat family protein [Akkermansiaceae bacterium]
MTIFSSLVVLFVLVGTSFAAISLRGQGEPPPVFEVEEVVEGDPSRFAVADFNKGRYLGAVLRARPLADTGNPFALLVMGLAYESGKGIDQSHELALVNYRKAVEAGNQEAPYRLAHLLISLGGEKNQKEARLVLEGLAEKEGGEAAWRLGEGYLKGWFGGESDFAKACSWWEKAAEKGNVTAMISLARLLDGEFGFSDQRDVSGALKQYVSAAELGFGPAMTRAGSRLLNGDEKTRDEEKGRKWLARAIESKQWDAYFVLGDYAEKATKSDETAYAEYLKGAEAGHGQCMLKVASFIMEGRGGQEKKPENALAWFKKAGSAGQVLGHVQAAQILLNGEGLKIVEGYNHLLAAAESGLVDMQNELGVLYLSGRLGVRDATAAASWFRRSASGKYPAGAFNLATLFEQGLGVPQNFDQAGQLYTMAANAGHAKSTTALGRFHAEGRATKQNLPRAWALFALALERGDTQAEGFKEKVGELLDEEGKEAASNILVEYQKGPSSPKDETGK